MTHDHITVLPLIQWARDITYGHCLQSLEYTQIQVVQKIRMAGELECVQDNGQHSSGQ